MRRLVFSLLVSLVTGTCHLEDARELHPPCSHSEQLGLSPSFGACGTKLSLELVEEINLDNSPTVQWENGKHGDCYTLVMVDPDAPYPGCSSACFWLHWMKVNIKPSDLKDGIAGDSEDLVPYAPPSPPGGVHRYQFYLLHQDGGHFHEMPDISPDQRGKFNLPSFMRHTTSSLAATFEYSVDSEKPVQCD